MGCHAGPLPLAPAGQSPSALRASGGHCSQNLVTSQRLLRAQGTPASSRLHSQASLRHRSRSQRGEQPSHTSRCRNPESRTASSTAPSRRHVFCQAAAIPAEPLQGGGTGDGSSGYGAGGGGGRDDSGAGDAGGEGEADDAQQPDELLSLSKAQQLAASAGVELPADFAQIAAAGGLRLSALNAYIALQGAVLGKFFAGLFPFVRDRLIVDPRFLFKIFAEVGIDAGCCTVAEVRKRGDDFWSEWEFYLSDLLVGCVLDCVLVTLLAPVAVLGARPASFGATGLKKWLGRVPSAVFEASIPGVRTYRVADRAACLGVKFLEYSLAGMVCGLVGQAMANSLMLLRRKYVGSSDSDVEVPDLAKTALVWGLFMGVSSNVRYQAVFGLERLVDLTIARKVPGAAYASTVAIRFVNNIIGGENFIDMARWAGVQ